jgi:hypothetical protein
MRFVMPVVHHGYGHSSGPDPSTCTIGIIRALFLNGTVPAESETDCYADGKPYPEGGEDDKYFSIEDFGILASQIKGRSAA